MSYFNDVPEEQLAKLGLVFQCPRSDMSYFNHLSANSQRSKFGFQCPRSDMSYFNIYVRGS